MGCFANRASYSKNSTIPANPTSSGTSTLAEDHGYTTPPHVSAMIQELELAMIKEFPLWRCQLKKKCTKSERDKHPVDLGEFLKERPGRVLEIQKRKNKDEREPAYR